MIKNNINFLYQCVIATSIFTPYVAINASNDLNAVDYRGASVLPTYKKNNVLYAVLSREAYGHDAGTYDSFGGSKDSYETPIHTAARECAEEMVSYDTMNLTINAMQHYIDPKKNNTRMVLVDQKRTYVLFITRFDKYIHTFLNRFYPAVHNATDYKYKEKDSIALIPWSQLAKAINNDKNKVCATVLNSHNNKEECLITLRPILILSLQNYFKKNPYQVNMNHKIRFYH